MIHYSLIKKTICGLKIFWINILPWKILYFLEILISFEGTGNPKYGATGALLYTVLETVREGKNFQNSCIFIKISLQMKKFSPNLS